MSAENRRKGREMNTELTARIKAMIEDMGDLSQEIWDGGYEKGKEEAATRLTEVKNAAYQEGYKAGVEYGREIQKAEDNEKAARDDRGTGRTDQSAGSRPDGKKKLVAIGDVAAGTTVRFADIEWTVLDTEIDQDESDELATLVLAKDVLFEKAFDEGNSNDWRNSTLRKYLNEEYLHQIREKLDADPIVPFIRDLTSEDGLKDYGKCPDKISLISCDEYRKYRQFIPDKSDWWWTLTPYSTPYSGSSHSARLVNTDGTLYANYAYNGNLGVSPAFCMSSDFVVEIVEED